MPARSPWGVVVALALAFSCCARGDDAPGGDRLPLVFRGMMGDLAVVEDLETTTQSTYHVGDRIRSAKVLEIHAAELVLDQHGKRIVLAMGDTLFAESQLAGDAAAPPCPWAVPEWADKLAGIYSTARVDLDFKAASLDDVVVFLRRFTGTSLLIDPEAQGRGKGPLAIAIRGEFVTRALAQILAQFGLELTYQDNVALITTREKAAANPITQAMRARADLVQVRNYLDFHGSPAGKLPSSSTDVALRDSLATIRITATFDAAPLAEVVEFIHATAKINIRIDTAHVDAAAEENRVSLGVKSAKLAELLDEVVRPRDLAYVLQEGFVVITSSAALEEQREKSDAETEAAAAREEQEAGVLATPMTLSFAGEPLYQVAKKVSEATKVPIIVDPKLWGPTPKVTYPGGQTLQDFVDGLEKSIEIRSLALRGKVYLVP